jgi:hypothetical protein
MAKFLNTSMDQWRGINDEDAQRFRSLFVDTVGAAHSFLSDRPFRPERALNGAGDVRSESCDSVPRTLNGATLRFSISSGDRRRRERQNADEHRN